MSHYQQYVKRGLFMSRPANYTITTIIHAHSHTHSETQAMEWPTPKSGFREREREGEWGRVIRLSKFQPVSDM